MKNGALGNTFLLLCGLTIAPQLAIAGLCEQGRRQSPIDIVAPLRKVLPSIEFQYKDAPLRIANDGHTVRVRLANGSQMQLGSERYVLQQFHFHTPGGERIAGEEFALAAHLIHKNKAGHLLVIVVLFRKGAENPLLTALLPRIPLQIDGDHVINGVSIDARNLLPARHAYYSYEGSLTAAPCTEGVTWLVMKQPLELSAEQLVRYKNIFADNARPVQPLNGRVVLESL